MNGQKTDKRFPFLSLCIPTFNRPHRLAKLLESIAVQPGSLLKDIEICVSDNSANDDSREACDYFSDKLFISYSKNISNIGANANILFVPCLARGEYCWILGDDDLIIDGTLERLIRNLKAYPDLAGIIVGYSYEQSSNRDRVVESRYRLAPTKPNYQLPHDIKVLDDWTNSFIHTNIAASHTAIVGSVFKRRDWISHAGSALSQLNSDDLESLSATFPHAVIWAHIFSGKRILFDPTPYVYFMIGDQEWFKPKWKTINYSFCLRLARVFRASTTNAVNADYYDKLLLKAGISQLLIKPSPYTLKHFSLEWVINNFGHYDELWDSLRELPSRKPLELIEYYLRIFGVFATGSFRSKLFILRKVIGTHSAGLTRKCLRKIGLMSRA